MLCKLRPAFRTLKQAKLQVDFDSRNNDFTVYIFTRYLPGHAIVLRNVIALMETLRVFKGPSGEERGKFNFAL